MYCPECGTENSNDNNYCAHCGTELLDGDSPDSESTDETSTGRKVGAVILAVMVIVGGFALASTLLASVTDDEAEGSEGPSTPTTESFTHGINDSFTVGGGDQSVRYTVTNVQSFDIIEGSGLSTEPDGKYLVITVEMTNVGDESFDIHDQHLKVVDAEGREFAADFEAAAYATEDPRIRAEGITYEQLNPGLTTTKAVVFDVSSSADYRLKVEPVGVFSTADEHYVELGSPNSSK